MHVRLDESYPETTHSSQVTLKICSKWTNRSRKTYHCYRPVSLLPFIAKTLERVVFNQVSLFHSQNNKLDAKQSGSGVAVQLRLRYSQDLRHHLQLILAKTELLVFSATPTLQHDFTIQLGSSTITPSASVRNLGVIFDDQLTFQEHFAKTARSCRFALHNIRKIRPFLTEHAAQLLVQDLVISRLDYCNALLAGLPSNTIKPLQIIQNAAAQLVFNEPKRAHVTPLFISLNWLPAAAHIKFKTLMLAYRTTTGSAPTYFHSLLQIHIPSRSPACIHSLLRIYIPSRSPSYLHSLLRIYIPSRSPAYFHSLLRIYIPSRSPCYFQSLLRIYIPSRSPAYFHSLLRIYIPSRSPSYFHSLLRIYIPSRSPAYFHSLLRIYIPSRSPAYFQSLLRIYIPSRSPAYFHSLLRIYIPSRSPAYFHSLLRIYIPSRSPAYFYSLLRIYIPSRSPAYFHSLLRIYIPSRSPAYFHSLLRIYIPSRSPAYFHSLLRIYIPSRRSASERRLVVPSQRGNKITLQNILVHCSWLVEWYLSLSTLSKTVAFNTSTQICRTSYRIKWNICKH